MAPLSQARTVAVFTFNERARPSRVRWAECRAAWTMTPPITPGGEAGRDTGLASCPGRSIWPEAAGRPRHLRCAARLARLRLGLMWLWFAPDMCPEQQLRSAGMVIAMRAVPF